MKIDRDPLITVTAALAAAISLLERTPKTKKAAASDKMFDQMLQDYRKALEIGREALKAPKARDPRNLCSPACADGGIGCQCEP
jgi:predicted solute-binding protein